MILFGKHVEENKTMHKALTQVYGIGNKRALFVCYSLGINPQCRVKDLETAGYLSKVSFDQLVRQSLTPITINTPINLSSAAAPKLVPFHKNYGPRSSLTSRTSITTKKALVANKSWSTSRHAVKTGTNVKHVYERVLTRTRSSEEFYNQLLQQYKVSLPNNTPINFNLVNVRTRDMYPALANMRGIIDADLIKFNADNIQHLKGIKCYRGLRHSMKLPTRGQRTKTNAKTVRRARRH